MEYYSVIKNKEIMNFTGKSIEFENIILNPRGSIETQTCPHEFQPKIYSVYMKYKDGGWSKD